MKKLLLFLFLPLFFISCTTEEEDPVVSTWNSISINGDTRDLTDPDLGALKLSSYWFDGEPDGVQFVVDAFDHDKSVIGNMGGFINNEIELFIDVYPRTYPAFETETSITSFTFNDYYRNLPAGEKQEFIYDKATLRLDIIAGDDDEIYIGSADGGQEFTVSYDNGFYYIIINNMVFSSYENGSTVTLSAKLKIID